jgi:transposase
MRFFLGEAAQAVVRCDPDWRRQYLHLMMRRSRQIAKVALARKLAVHLYWMWRKEMERQRTLKIGPHARLLA